jgi:hypothetical protein
MKRIKAAIATGLIIFSILILQKFLPWWISGLISFFCGFFLINRKYTSFLLCFLVSGMTWVSLAFIKDYNAEVSIANLVSSIFKDIGKLPVYLITGLIIAFLNGFLGLSGNYFKRMLLPKQAIRRL